MKKLFSIFLVLTLMVGMLAGCSKPSTTDTAPAPAPEAAPATETTAPATEGIVKLGMGHITVIDKSADLLGQVDTAMVAAGFDKDGKVVSVTFDNAQTKVNFDQGLQLASDPAAEYKTKVELGAEYGMVKASTIGKEWFEQAAELEKWMVGKTVAEIKAMKTKGEGSPDVAELTSSVTVSVKDFVAVLEEAFNNAVDVQAGAVKVGLGHNIDISKSTGLATKDGKEVLPQAEVNTVMVATAFDADGKVAGVIIDTAQTKVQFDKAGKVTTDKAGEFKTKVELGDAYGMIKGSKIGKEWYQQMAELQKWMTGKTVEEIKAMKANAQGAPDVAELTSSVTISVQNFVAGVEEGFAKAK